MDDITGKELKLKVKTAKKIFVDVVINNNNSVWFEVKKNSALSICNVYSKETFGYFENKYNCLFIHKAY